jgi:hypothetical protein
VTRRFKPPVYSTTKRGTTRWVLNIGADERAVIGQLLTELSALLNDDSDANSPLLQRLFPTAYPDDAEKEAEYQRLMREDLVASRVFQIDTVVGYLNDDDATLDQGEIIALMQSVNAVRVVLGTMIDVGEDDEIGVGEAGDEHEVERQLYGFLSWLLDWIVRSLQDV